jgi:hypothetical protein
MSQFKEGEQVHIVTKWQDPSGTVNARGEVAAVIAVVGRVLEGGKTAAVTQGTRMVTLPLIDGFAFRDQSKALSQAEAYAKRYYRKGSPDPFAGQSIPS